MSFPDTAAPLNRTLSARGYTTPTAVQEAVLKSELADRDLLVSAQTGSGKTVAFGLAIAPTLLPVTRSACRRRRHPGAGHRTDA